MPHHDRADSFASLRAERTAARRSVMPRSVTIDALLLSAVAAVFARLNYFFQDDAYISLRYARNLARGFGLVWSPASSEFGYTNFLFTVMEAALLKLGMSPVAAANLISMPASLAAVLLAYALCRKLSGNRIAALAAGVAIATHTSFSASASGGLETSLQTLLVLLTYWLVWRYLDESTYGSASRAGVAAALAMLCRLDSVLLIAPAVAWPAWQVWRERRRNGQPATAGYGMPLLIIGIPVTTTLLFLLACHVYYGSALPNTFYAKVAGESRAAGFGFQYLLRFLAVQAGFPVALGLMSAGALVSTGRNGVSHHPFLALFCIAGFLWLAYLLYVGGDLMEFRMLVPIVPLYVVCGYAVLGGLKEHHGMRPVVFVLLTVIAVGANLSHRALLRERLPGWPIESTRSLHLYLTRHPGWVDAGRSLNQLFHTGGADQVVIATAAAGAIPFYSDLPTVDQLGLNDRYIAKHGVYYTSAPGHRRAAPIEYLRSRGVNLVIGHPEFATSVTQAENPYPGLPLILIPLTGSASYLQANYLTPHATIESLLANGTLKVAP